LLLIVILAGLSGVANAQEPPSGQPLRWEEIYKPGINGEIIVVPSEINRIAASQDIVYALDTANSGLHRSQNGGLTFENITAPLIGAVGISGMPGWEIAVAPGLPQYVAVVTNDRTKVFISNDSGATWHDGTYNLVLALGEQIQCIAISNGYLSGSTLVHDVAIGTAQWDNVTGNGQVWTFQMGGSFSTWTNNNAGLPVADISAVAFSPSYKNDSTILAMASTTGTDNATNLCIGTRDLWGQTTAWDNVTGYPVKITAEGDAAGAKIVSSISLPSDYNGTDPRTRLAFVGYNRSPAGSSNDVYRIDDDADPQVQRLFYPGGGASINISSIAYFGTEKSGKLLAGLTDSTENAAQVKWTITPLGNGTLNSTVWYNDNLPPSGPGNAQVAWSSSGAVAFCGTGQDSSIPLDESAFSQSLDNGNNWQQTSLMNTNIHITDIAPAPDSRSLFMATYSDFAPKSPESVWRSAGEPLGQYWSRMLNMPTNTNRVILRLSPDYATDYTLYAVEVDDNKTISENSTIPLRLQISENRGNTWKKRFIPGPVIDVVTAGQLTLFMATSGGCVRKSTDGGLTWGDKIATGLNNINMLAIIDNGHLFAGSTDGWVAYSGDGGASFTEIPVPVSFVLNDIQVVPDANYAANNIIYASGRTDGPPGHLHIPADNVTGGVWRWTIGQSSKWEQIDTPIANEIIGEQISGLKTGPEGTLYVLRADSINGRSGGINRTLDPVYPIPELMEWDVVNRTLPLNIPPNEVAFNPAPLNFAGDVPWLKLSGDTMENDLWAIDTSNEVNDNTTAIYMFRDTLCKAGPWSKGPSEVGSDPVTGRNSQVDLSWEQLSLSDRYELQVAKDPAFDLRVDPAINNTENVTAVTGSILISTDPDNVLSPAVWLPPGSLPEAGAGYYWRVRTDHAATGEYIRSPWSDALTFIVKPGFRVAAPYYGPQLLSPADGSDYAANASIGFSWSPNKDTTKYKFELSQRSDMSRPLLSTTVSGPALLYAGQLRSDTAYFWRVTPVEPVPGDSSATFSFHTAATAAPPASVTRVAQLVPLWVIIGSALGLLACIVMLVLILRRWGMFSREDEGS
jgi:hypothetical protein